MNVDLFLHFGAPPLIGAFIGYMTNYVAIRMLFRPLYPWRIFGIRVPFTPGIIPAHRQELAATMGRTVGKHLVTAEDAGKALERDAVQKELSEIVDDKVTRLFSTEYGTLNSMLRPDEQRWLDDAIDVAADLLSKRIGAYVESAAFGDSVRKLVQKLEKGLLSHTLEETVSADVQEEVLSHLRVRLDDALASSEAARLTEAFVSQTVANALTSERRLDEILPDPVKQSIFSLVDKELPALLERLSERLQDPEVRDRLVVRLEGVVHEIPRSLGGLTGFLAGFVNPEKIKARLPEFVDRAGTEIAVWLSDEQTRGEIAEQTRGRLNEWLQHSLGELAAKLSEQQRQDMLCFLQHEAVRVLRKPETPEVAIKALHATAERMHQRTLQSLLYQVLPRNTVEHMHATLVDGILDSARSPQAKDVFADIIREQLVHLCYDRPVGKLEDKVPLHIRDAVPELAYKQVLEILRTELPALLESLNVEQMVEDNINSLPILEVEGMLLAIMRKQFVYINLFGAILGFLIGCLNILLHLGA
ncbi:MAG: DUF445 family protein [Candidatus Pacebacteria bacterium]|nr:DUF445 family protein [Candidatus Paceibacterota bacterium]